MAVQKKSPNTPALPATCHDWCWSTQYAIATLRDEQSLIFGSDNSLLQARAIRTSPIFWRVLSTWTSRSLLVSRELIKPSLVGYQMCARRQYLHLDSSRQATKHGLLVISGRVFIWEGWFFF